MSGAQEVAAKLTKAQREAKWYGVGHRRLPRAVLQLQDAGIVRTLPARSGWSWKPTPLGLAVRRILQEQEHAQ